MDIKKDLLIVQIDQNNQPIEKKSITRPSSYESLKQSIEDSFEFEENTSFIIYYLDNTNKEINITKNEEFKKSGDIIFVAEKKNLEKSTNEKIKTDLSVFDRYVIDEKYKCRLCFEKLIENLYYCGKCTKRICKNCLEKNHLIAKKNNKYLTCPFCKFELVKEKPPQIKNLEDNKNELLAYVKKNQKLKEENLIYEIKKSELLRQLAKANQEIKIQTLKINQKDKKIEQLKQKLKNPIKNKINWKKEKVEEINKLKEELNKLLKQVEEKDNTIKEIQKDIKILSEQLKKSNEKINNQSFLLEQKEKIINNNFDQLIKFKKQSDEKDFEIGKLQKEIKKLTEQLSKFNIEKNNQIEEREVEIKKLKDELNFSPNQLTKINEENNNILLYKDMDEKEENDESLFLSQRDMEINEFKEENSFLDEIKILNNNIEGDKNNNIEDCFIYNVKKNHIDKDGYVRILGYDFIKNNNGTLIINDNIKLDYLVYKYKLQIGINKIKINIKNQITNFSYMFSNCESLKSISSFINWDVSNGINFSGMFSNCSSLKDISPIKNWNVSNGIDFSYMFSDCKSLKDLSPLRNWNVNHGNDFSYMFFGCVLLNDLSLIKNWNISNGKDFNDMFYGIKNISKNVINNFKRLNSNFKYYN